MRPEAAEVTPEVPARAQRLSRRPPRAQTRLVDSFRLSFTVVIGRLSTSGPPILTARGFEVARAKMVAFGHPNHHTRQPVGDGGTAQCLWHSAVGTRGNGPAARLSRAAEPAPEGRGRSGRVWQLLR